MLGTCLQSESEQRDKKCQLIAHTGPGVIMVELRTICLKIDEIVPSGKISCPPHDLIPPIYYIKINVVLCKCQWQILFHAFLLMKQQRFDCYTVIVHTLIGHGVITHQHVVIVCTGAEIKVNMKSHHSASQVKSSKTYYLIKLCSDTFISAVQVLLRSVPTHSFSNSWVLSHSNQSLLPLWQDGHVSYLSALSCFYV